MAETRTDSATRGPNCPSMKEMEAAAESGAISVDCVAHLASCRACGDLLRVMRANNAFLREITGPEPISGVSSKSIIPGYTLIEELRRGGQGVVYKALQENTRRVVAIKMLTGGAFASARQRARFEREVELAASLKHPNIVTIFDGGLVEGGQFAFAMEYVDGVRMDEWKPPGATLAARRESLIRLFIKVCDAVQHAHQNLIAHRDLKPANILVTNGRRSCTCWISGSRRLGEMSPLATATGEFVCSMPYAFRSRCSATWR